MISRLFKLRRRLLLFVILPLAVMIAILFFLFFASKPELLSPDHLRSKRISWTYDLANSAVPLLPGYLRQTESYYQTEFVGGSRLGYLYSQPQVLATRRMVLVSEAEAELNYSELPSAVLTRLQTDYPEGREAPGLRAFYYHGNATIRIVGKVTALTPDGKLLWSRHSPYSVWYPAHELFASPSGTAYCVDYEDLYGDEPPAIRHFELAELTPAGPSEARVRFVSPTDKRIQVVQVADDSVYAREFREGSLFCFDHLGKLKWSFDESGVVDTAQKPDGTVTILTRYSEVISLDGDGKALWRKPMGEHSGYSMSLSEIHLAPDSSVVSPIGGYPYLFALAPDGRFRWCLDPAKLFSRGELEALHNFYPNQIIESGAAFAIDSQILVHSRGGTLCSLAPDGTVNWTFRPREARGDPDYTIWLVDNPSGPPYILHGRQVDALSADGELRWRVKFADTRGRIDDDYLTLPVVGPDGTVYEVVGNTVYALNPE